MKKLSILVASVAAAVAFTSCETSHDDNPVLTTFDQVKTVHFLNEPVLQDQYIKLTDANSAGALQLTCSQPTEYGYAASVRYIPQVSLTENFADYREYANDWSSDCAAVAVTNGNVAEAVCEMLGAQDVAELPTDYYPVYVRLRAAIYTINGVEVANTTILSNPVEFKHVNVGYLALWIPGEAQDLYLVGSISNWGADATYQFKTGAEKNTWVTDHISIAAGSEFKVSPAVWNAPFNGEAFNAGSNGAAIVADEKYELNNDSGSGNIAIASDFNGVAQLTYKSGKYILLLIPD